MSGSSSNKKPKLKLEGEVVEYGECSVTSYYPEDHQVASEYQSESDFDDDDDDDDDDDTEIVQVDNAGGVVQRDGGQEQDNDEIGSALELLQGHVEITNSNALLINQRLQSQLLVLRTRLEAMLHICRTKYAANERILTHSRLSSQPAAIAISNSSGAASFGQHTTKRHDIRQTSFSFYGAPFFKTVECFSAPYNAEYQRSRSAGHLSPIDLDERPISWTTRDKLLLIRGVREQVIQQLQRQHNNWLRQHKNFLRRLKPDAESSSNHAAQLDSHRQSLATVKLADLMARLDNGPAADFTIDWYTVSVQHLHNRHCTNECQALWCAYLQPHLNRAAWTTEEEERLMSAAAEFEQQNWPAIAGRMENRSSYQCLVHFRTKLFEHTQRSGRWTADEDALLLRLVPRHCIGTHISWDAVAAGIAGRTRHQAYVRYTFSLRPDIRRDKFSVEEDCVLMAAYKQYGTMFEKFMPLLPGRTRVQIRNRYQNVLRHEHRTEQWTTAGDRRLLELVAKYGESDWAKVAAELGSHTRTSCRSRFVRIQEFLQRRPDAKLEQMPRRKVKRTATVTTANWMDTLIQLNTDQGSVLPDEAEERESGTADGGVEAAVVVVINNASPTGPSRRRPAAANGRTTPREQLLEFLRYAYGRLQLRVLRDPEAPTTRRTEAVCRVLQSPACPVSCRLLHATPEETVNMMHLKPELAASGTPLKPQSANLLLPASASTARLLRGLALMFPPDAGDQRQSDGNSAAGCRSQMFERTKSLNLFRRRFRAMLLNVAMMAQVKAQLTLGAGSQQAASDAGNGTGDGDDETGSFNKVTDEGTFHVEFVTPDPDQSQRKRKRLD